MRVVRFYNSEHKLAGLGLMWGDPLTVIAKSFGGRILGAMLNYGVESTALTSGTIEAKDRCYLPICEECKDNPAAVWCRSHCVYVCEDCLYRCSDLHDGCQFYSLAAKAAAHV